MYISLHLKISESFTKASSIFNHISAWWKEDSDFAANSDSVRIQLLKSFLTHTSSPSSTAPFTYHPTLATAGVLLPRKTPWCTAKVRESSLVRPHTLCLYFHILKHTFFKHIFWPGNRWPGNEQTAGRHWHCLQVTSFYLHYISSWQLHQTYAWKMIQTVSGSVPAFNVL